MFCFAKKEKTVHNQMNLCMYFFLVLHGRICCLLILNTAVKMMASDFISSKHIFISVLFRLVNENIVKEYAQFCFLSFLFSYLILHNSQVSSTQTSS